MYKNENLDGVVEVFKEKDRQGYLIKLYKSFDPDDDLCIWVYENLDSRTIHTIIANHSNCNELNQCVNSYLKCHQYPVVKNIKKDIVEDLINIVYDHYNKNIRM